MAEAERSNNDTWIQQWIEQQRLLLQQRSGQQPGGPSAQMHDLGHKWLDLGQAYLAGLEQFAHGTHPGGTTGSAFQLVTDFISGWRARLQSLATYEPKTSDSAASWSDVLRQLPPIGLAREHNVTLRELAEAHAEYERLEQALRTVLFGVQTDA